MFRKILAVLCLVPVCACYGIGAGSSGFGTTERIGNLQVGSFETEVMKSVPCPLTHEKGFVSATVSQKGTDLFKGDSFRYNETWGNGDCGITIEMIGIAHSARDTRPDGPMWVKSILIYSGKLNFATARGIRVGSTEQDVINAYGREMNPKESLSGTVFVAGSQASGLIFGFEKGRVNTILLRAGVY